MGSSRWLLLLCACLIPLPPAAGVAAQPDEPTGLVADLADPDVRVREQAMEALWSLRDAAVPALEEAARSPVPEVARRARLLLERLKLGIDPGTPEVIVELAVVARESDSRNERSQARQRLAASVSAAAPPIARLLRDAVLGDPAAGPDPRDTILAELWPPDPWMLARVADELARTGEHATLLAWLEQASRGGAMPAAAPNYAYAVRELGDLPAEIDRWRERLDEEPTPQARRVLGCLLFAAGDREAAQGALEPLADSRLLPVAWALLDGDIPGAQAIAREHPEELVRHSLELVLSRLAAGTGAGAGEQVSVWLSENTERLRTDLRRTPSRSTAEARRAILAAVYAGQSREAFGLADEIDAAGLIRVLCRRLEYEAAWEIADEHVRRRSPQLRSVQIMQRRMLDELRPRTQGRFRVPELSGFARTRLEAGEALREERFAAAAAAYGELVEADDGDPALRWAWGHSLAALGKARGEEEAARAISMSMANGWVRRGVAEEMWLVDQREAALEQYREAARWSLLVPLDGLTALEAYSNRLMELGRYDEAHRAVAASLVLLLAEDTYSQLADLDRGLYFACFLMSQLERVEMNLAAQAGDWEAAEAALARSVAQMPQTEAAIDLVTALDAAGEEERADRIFRETFAPLYAAVNRYRQSSMLNNQAAWLATSCGRRLDTALTLAQTAVACDRSSPAALDTLADVHARRGEGERALELMDDVLALAEAADVEGGSALGQLNDYILRREKIRRLVADSAKRP